MKVIVKGPGQPGEIRDFPDSVDEQLKALQMAVGGYIETVRVATDLIAVVDEEGKMKGKARNILGLVGTIVFVGPVNRKGAFTRIPQDAPLLLEVI